MNKTLRGERFMSFPFYRKTFAAAAHSGGFCFGQPIEPQCALVGAAKLMHHYQGFSIAEVVWG